MNDLFSARVQVHFAINGNQLNSKQYSIQMFNKHDLSIPKLAYKKEMLIRLRITVLFFLSNSQKRGKLIDVLLKIHDGNSDP